MEGSNFNFFAKDYHSKRKKAWRPLKIFLSHLKNKGTTFNGIILDLGCGNGRNFKILGDSPMKLVGIDISLELIKIVKENLKNLSQFSQFESKFYQILLGDIKNLPIRPDSIQNIFSIAAIHHIQKNTVRKDLIIQLFKILKTNGNLILTVWRKWQKKYRVYFIIDWFKRKFNNNHREQQNIIGLHEFGDKYVPWTISNEQKIYKRYYHFFSKREIKKILEKFTIKEFQIMGGPNKRDNFFIYACKSKH
ncbi:hypothetical protein LCGC14_2133310 [marine sediment metagenome]|uniref:Methyltransferase type 11 domain-containing protein n=1 Tax=marine sediment metagenome TaxID=412755 RepID=A0A0F9EMW0_9ZZZZ